MRKFLAILLLTALLPLHAQELEWSVDANALINNREGGDEATPDQTFLFTRLTPQIGVSLDSAQHRLRGMRLGLYYSNPDWHHPGAYNGKSTHQIGTISQSSTNMFIFFMAVHPGFQGIHLR